MKNNEPKSGIFPTAMVNITNRCSLHCAHCFVYRPGNANNSRNEMSDDALIARLKELKEKHGIQVMLWMGGEPLLRPEALRRGAELFAQNNVTTNGLHPLIELPRCIYVVSVDGPPDVNDRIRGARAFERVMKNMETVPKDFGPKVMCQCVVTRTNEDRLEELVELLRPTRFEGMTFSFYVPPEKDESGLGWGSLEKRDGAVREVMRLKRKYPEFIWNKSRSLELTLSQNAKSVTDNCPSKRYVLPLYMEREDFSTPFCCYGNDVDCDLCGAWVVFHLAAIVEKGDFMYTGKPVFEKAAG